MKRFFELLWIVIIWLVITFLGLWFCAIVIFDGGWKPS